MLRISCFVGVIILAAAVAFSEDDEEPAPEPPTRATSTQPPYTGPSIFTTRRKSATKPNIPTGVQVGRRVINSNSRCDAGSTRSSHITIGFRLWQHYEASWKDTEEQCWNECNSGDDDPEKTCECVAASYDNEIQRNVYPHNCFLFRTSDPIYYTIEERKWRTSVRCCEGGMEDSKFLATSTSQFPRCSGRPGLIKSDFQLALSGRIQKFSADNAENCWKKSVICSDCVGVTFNKNVKAPDENCYLLMENLGGTPMAKWVSMNNFAV